MQTSTTSKDKDDLRNDPLFIDDLVPDVDRINCEVGGRTPDTVVVINSAWCCWRKG